MRRPCVFRVRREPRAVSAFVAGQRHERCARRGMLGCKAISDRYRLPQRPPATSQRRCRRTAPLRANARALPARCGGAAGRPCTRVAPVMASRLAPQISVPSRVSTPGAAIACSHPGAALSSSFCACLRTAWRERRRKPWRQIAPPPDAKPVLFVQWASPNTRRQPSRASRGKDAAASRGTASASARTNVWLLVSTFFSVLETTSPHLSWDRPLGSAMISGAMKIEWLIANATVLKSLDRAEVNRVPCYMG